MKVSRQGFYSYLRRGKSNLAIENEVLCEKIKESYENSKGLYGSPRIAEELNKKGIFTSKNRVARLMQKMKLQAKTYKRKKGNYRKISENLLKENLLNQNFKSNKKNEIWAGDITYIPLQNKYIYLASFLDICTRKVVGWHVSRKIDEELVLKAFRNSIVREKDLKGLIIHTDRGSQYTSKRYQNEVREIGAVSSMSRAGNPYDNALMESFYKTLKTELLINGSFETEEEAKNAIFEYIEIYYNRQRLHSSLGYLSPVEYEEKISYLNSV